METALVVTLCAVGGLLAVVLLGWFLLSLMLDGRVWNLFPGWRVKNMPDQTGKVAIVTGPTINGIGYEACVAMARKGAHVIMAGRNKTKGEEALAALRARVPSAKAEFMELDLGSLKSVKAFTENFKAKALPLHILMNSAGVMMNPFTLTVDGLESQFATNHLGHFLLTMLLLPVLEESQPSRIVTTTSAAAHFPDMKKRFTDVSASLDFDRVGQDYEVDYAPSSAYDRSKLANVLFTQALNRRLAGKKIYVNAAHPGGIKTNLVRHLEADLRSAGAIMLFVWKVVKGAAFMSAAKGCTTQLFLATAKEVETKNIRGKYYRPQALKGALPRCATEELQEKLWTVSEKLVADYLLPNPDVGATVTVVPNMQKCDH